MKKLKIYLDTSVWNFIFANDSPEKQEITKTFFSDIHRYEIFISIIVIEEILQAPNKKRIQLEKLLSKYKPQILEMDDEIERLAKQYIDKGIISTQNANDALHIACSTFYEMDILLSWNYKHLANVFKKKKIMIANLEEGYDKPLDLITPMEVIQDEKE